MAIYLFSLRGLNRHPPTAEVTYNSNLSRHQPTLAAAAYRAAVCLVSEKNKHKFDFSYRKGLVHSQILAPENAPTWVYKRQMLWNKAEKAEQSTEGQLARSLVLGLPHELDDAQRRKLVETFLRQDFVALGMVADYAIYKPVADQNPNNHYAHAMLTNRVLITDGFGQKNSDWGAKPNLLRWREQWAIAVNDALARAGRSERVDHRSLKDQGIKRVPSKHPGPRTLQQRLADAYQSLRRAGKAKITSKLLAEYANASPSSARNWLKLHRDDPDTRNQAEGGSEQKN